MDRRVLRAQFQSAGRDRECWILGNGPSLDSRPWPPGAVLFGCNYVFLSDVMPQFYGIIDRRMLHGSAEAILQYAKRAALVYITQNLVRDNSIEVRALYRLPQAVIAEDVIPRWPGEKAWSGATIVYPLIKAAYGRGYRRINLVGVDQDEKFSHAVDTYPGAAKPRMGWMRYHFRIAAEKFVREGVDLVNYSLPSPLDEFIRRPL